ncbi:hypothetical protein Ancab_001366, partial [Ancistrocladus abbreviatus]
MVMIWWTYFVKIFLCRWNGNGDIDDKCMEADKVKIGEGTKGVDWKIFFDQNNDSLDLIHEDILRRLDSNRGAEPNVIDDNCMEADKTKIGKGTKK